MRTNIDHTDSQEPLQLLNSKNLSIDRNGSYIYKLWQPPTFHDDQHLRDRVFSLIDVMMLLLRFVAALEALYFRMGAH